MRRLALALWLIAAFPASPADQDNPMLFGQWQRIGDSNLELYSNAGEKPARDALRQLEQVRGFFLKASPVPLLDQFPVRVVLFKTQEQFARYTATPIQRAFYVAGPKRDYIVMSDSPGEHGFAIHEYMHLIERHSGLRLPTWLNEGWADVYSTMRPAKDGVAIGDLLENRFHDLQNRPWIDIDTLTSLNHNSPIYQGKGPTELFYAESWALTHMLFLAPDYSGNFPKFIAAIHRGKTFNDACQAAFGKASAQVYLDLRNYFKRKKMYGKVFEVSLESTEPTSPFSPVDPFDVRLALADLLVATGRPDQAKPEFAELAREQPNRFEVSESLGFLAFAARDKTTARQQFEKAFAAGDPDPRMCLTLAILERDTGQPAERIMPPLERAVESKPDYTDALLQLGSLQIAAQDYQSGVATLLRIEKISSDLATPVYTALAYGLLQTGDLARARKDADTARQYARNPNQIRQLDAIAALADARARIPAAPHSGEKTLRLEGSLNRIDCSATGNRLTLNVADTVAVLDLPDSRAVEFIHPGAGTITFTCGPQKPLQLKIDYVPAAIMGQSTAGVIRRIQY